MSKVQKASRPRPLGSIRVSAAAMDTVPKFPPLHTPRSEPQQYIGGIHGNAMTVPPPPPPRSVDERPMRQHSHRLVASPRSDSNSGKSDERAAAAEASIERARAELRDAVVSYKGFL